VKVLLVSQPGTDGVLRHVDGLARFLIRNGVEVDLGYSDRQHSPQLHALVEHVRSSGGTALNLRVNNMPEPADAAALWSLRQLAGRRRPEVIHGHSSKAGALVRTLPFLGVPGAIFYTPHAYYRMHSADGAKARFFHRVERMLGGIGTTINMSRCEARFRADTLRLAPERQVIVANGVDCARFKPVDVLEKRRLRDQLGLPPDAKTWARSPALFAKGSLSPFTQHSLGLPLIFLRRFSLIWAKAN
jgi:glycosyltransferase involved in cell wall biosynthesis